MSRQDREFEPISTIVAEVLGSSRPDLDGNFFDLGGDSMAANYLVTVLEERCGVRIDVSDVFAASSIREIGRLVADASECSNPQSEG